MSKRMKTILIGLVVFLALAVGAYVVYTVNNSAPSKPAPTAAPKASPNASPTTAPVFQVTPTNACSLSFSVAAELVPGLNCVSKELYKDVASNTAGTYTLTGNKLAADFVMKPGEKYIYVISYKNSGTGAIDGVVTDTLPTGLTYLDSSEGCSVASGTNKVTCTVPEVAAAGAGQFAIRFVVQDTITADSVTNTATLTPTSGDASTCSLSNAIATPTPSPSSSPVGEASLSCVAKRAYQDNASNSAGSYFLNTEITDTNTLEDGQTVVFNVAIRNSGGASVPDAEITDVLSSNLTFVDADSGCTYDSSSRTLTCVVGSLAAGTETSRSFRATIVAASTTAIANTADVTSSNGQRDSCSITISAGGQVIVQEASPIPSTLPTAGVFEVTAGTLGLGVLLLIVGALGLILI